MMQYNYRAANPEIVCDTADLCLTVNGKIQRDAAGNPLLDEEAWLKIRRGGIGGSDAAAVLGISPWKSKQELMDDKRGVKPLAARELNATAKMAGHMYEPVIREQVLPYLLSEEGHKGIRVGNDTKMYQHGNPDYSFARADLDGLVLVDGQICVAEIKTTSPRNIHAIEQWKDGIVPGYYGCQVRHYMAVMNIDCAYICCAWGLNPREEAVAIKVGRDLELEKQLMDAERKFWEDHVVNGSPILPEEETCDPKIIIDYYGRRNSREKNSSPASADILAPIIPRREILEEQAENLAEQRNSILEEIECIDAQIILQLDGKEYGTCAGKDKNHRYDIYAKPKLETKSYNVEEVQKNFPEIWDKASKVSFSPSKLSTSEKALIAPYLLPQAPTGKINISVKEVEVDANGKRVKAGKKTV